MHAYKAFRSGKNRGTYLACAALGLACGLWAWSARAGTPTPTPTPTTPTPTSDPTPPTTLVAASVPVAGPDELAQAEDLRLARGLSRAFQSVARKLEPSVVQIRVTQAVRDMWGRERQVQGGVGSGAIVSTDGYVITNNHVVAPATALEVVLTDGRQYPAKLIGRDQPTDLAVIKIEADESFQAATFADSDSAQVGEWVVTIGSPFGFDNTVTAGIISAKGRGGINLPGQSPDDLLAQEFIQTDAAINPGNSGGPMLNLEGQIIGINSAIASRTGGYDGIGFAIPSNTVKAVMESLINNGRVVRGWLGVTMEPLDPNMAGKYRLGGGVFLRDVSPGGPADVAGLQPKDIVVGFRGRPIESFARLRNAISLTPPGTAADIEVVRDGERKTLRATIVDRATAIAQAIGGVRVESVGLTVRTLDDDLRRQLRFTPRAKGVVVADVEVGSLAQREEFRTNDVIVGVDGREFDSAEEFVRLVNEADLDRGVRFDVIRGRMSGYVEIRR